MNSETKSKGDIMPQVPKEEQKQVLKEAIQEWLDEKYKELGRWTFRGLLAICFALIVYHYLKIFGIGKGI